MDSPDFNGFFFVILGVFETYRSITSLLGECYNFDNTVSVLLYFPVSPM